MLNETQKNTIVDALEVYMEEHRLSQNQVMQKSGVNASYLIAIRKRQWALMIKDKPVPIQDTHFNKLARMLGVQFKQDVIETKITPQFEFILSKLQDAMDNAEGCVLIGQTGAGKTYALDAFKRQYPNDVFTIKIGSNDTAADVLDKINDEVGAYLYRAGKSRKIKDICISLKALKDAGARPVLVFDESEFMKQPTLCAVKEIIDALLYICPLVLVGTYELIDNIGRLVLRKKPGMAQLHRRLKFKTHHMPTVDRKFTDFIENYPPTLKSWLTENCNNYGELTDVLRPCLRESKRLNVPLSVELIETVMSL